MQRAGTTWLESSKCMWNSTIEFVFNPRGGEGAREGNIITVPQGCLLLWQAIIIQQWVGWGGHGQVQVVLEGRETWSLLEQAIAGHAHPAPPPPCLIAEAPAESHPAPINLSPDLSPWPGLSAWVPPASGPHHRKSPLGGRNVFPHCSGPLSAALGAPGPALENRPVYKTWGSGIAVPWLMWEGQDTFPICSTLSGFPPGTPAISNIKSGPRNLSHRCGFCIRCC